MGSGPSLRAQGASGRGPTSIAFDVSREEGICPRPPFCLGRILRPCMSSSRSGDRLHCRNLVNVPREPAGTLRPTEPEDPHRGQNLGGTRHILPRPVEAGHVPGTVGSVTAVLPRRDVALGARHLGAGVPGLSESGFDRSRIMIGWLRRESEELHRPMVAASPAARQAFALLAGTGSSWRWSRPRWPSRDRPCTPARRTTSMPWQEGQPGLRGERRSRALISRPCQDHPRMCGEQPS